MFSCFRPTTLSVNSATHRPLCGGPPRAYPVAVMRAQLPDFRTGPVTPVPVLLCPRGSSHWDKKETIQGSYTRKRLI